MTEQSADSESINENGVFNEKLDSILKRFNTKKTKIINCGEGWYPLLKELNKKLSTLYPYYEIVSIQSRDGKLKYSWTIPHDFHLDYFEEDEEHFETIYSIMSDVVKHGEYKSLTICEKCGKRKQRGGRLLHEPLCVKCTGV